VFGTAYCSGVIASGLPMRRRNSTAFRCFDSASLRVITLAISPPSMVRRECGSRPGIVASEELVPKSLARNRGRRIPRSGLPQHFR